MLFCTGAEVTESMILPLPSTDLVDDSARGYINIIGNIILFCVKLQHLTHTNFGH